MKATKVIESEYSKALIAAKKDKKQTNISCGSGAYLIVSAGTAKSNFYCRLPYLEPKTGDRKYELYLLGAYDKSGKNGIGIADARKLAVKTKGKRKQELESKSKIEGLPKFGDYWLKWLSFQTESVKANKQALHNTTLSALDDYRLDEISPKLILDTLLASPFEYNRYNGRQAIKSLFDLALIEYHNILTDNPAEHLRGSACPIKKPKKTRDDGWSFVLANDLGEKVFTPLKAMPLLQRYFFLLQAFTAMRFDNVLQMRWAWVDYEKALITIPIEFCKTKEIGDYEIPITKQIERLLKNLKRDYSQDGFDCVFYSSSSKGISDKPLHSGSIRGPYVTLIPKKKKQAKAKDGSSFLQDVPIHDPHGFRKSLATWLEENQAPDKLSDRLLCHVVNSDNVHRAYDHSKEIHDKNKRLWLQKYNDYLEQTQLPPEFLELIKDC